MEFTNEKQGADAEGAANEPTPARGEALATGAAAAGGATVPPPAADDGPWRPMGDPSRENDALDLEGAAGGATVKRLLPAATIAVVLAVVLAVLRRRR